LKYAEYKQYAKHAELTFLIHNLAGGGSQNPGYHAFIWEMILHGNAGKGG
jgi:hypothetical protein